MTTDLFANGPRTFLPAGCTDTDLTVTVSSTTPFQPLLSGQQYRCRIDPPAPVDGGPYEIVYVTGPIGDYVHLTLVRAQEGTVARDWAPGSSITHVLTAGGLASAISVETVRAEAAETTNATAITTETSRAAAAEALKAPLAGPTFTGHVTVPAPTSGGDATTKTYVDAADTTNATAITTETSRAAAAEALKAPLAAPTFTGHVTVPAPTSGTDATTKTYVDTADTTNATAITAEASRAAAAEALKAPLASPTFTGTVTVPTPVASGAAATKGYVDAVAQGLSPKGSAAAATTTNRALSGLTAVDGYTPIDGDRILLMGQSTGSQNGLYVAHAGSWTRPSDFAAGSNAAGSFVFVEGGTANAGAGFVLASTSAVTVDTTSQTWTQFSGAGEITVGTGLTKSGNQLAADFATVAHTLTVAAITTTADTLVANQVTPYNAAGGALAPLLPAGAAVGTIVAARKDDSSANAVTVTSQGSDVIHGLGGATGTTLPITFAARTVTFVKASSTQWLAIADHVPESTLTAKFAASMVVGGTPQGATSSVLLGWTLAEAYRIVSATRDANEAITTASVVWPDGVTGTFTTDTASTAFPGAIDAYHITYVGSPTLTVTQTAVTRDGNGAVTAQPALTVA